MLDWQLLRSKIRPRCRHPHEAHCTPLLVSKLAIDSIAAIVNHGEMAGSLIPFLYEK
ncbi:protein of unknown function [Methylotuvimicrobium alcaliphilum 20Z]|uniref:Uncharacterized protein n=1 Tax=Methylotuvimicrobium alcaliphilum (strain DSM 19304 / NCIMB 14124 / VKM B-2133 / 20Z) TaxID=1091494 RepID=G4SZ97_META2|nr:protein of unknown function [Methylotuvimicrobium alcaliphilum 20Z]